jgi:hypothetical protein
VPAAPLAALDALLALESGQASPPDGLDLPALEAQLQQLGASAWGGAWLHAAVALGTTLDGTAALLEQAAARPYCRQGRPTPEARILQTVFWKFYAGRVQPYLSQVHRQGEAWLQRHAALLASQRVTPPPAFADYAARALGTGEGSVWQRLGAARERHTRAWQELLGQCGLMPDAAQRKGEPEGSPG